MPEQQADVAELAQLVAAMGELKNYCDALRQGATVFAYMLPNEWQGPAMSAFIGNFEAWAVSAGAMYDSATQLEAHAKAVDTAYDTAITNLDTMWNSIKSSIPDS
ncbi:hypothetical protein [Agromyces sp. LHK192]|uniref:hypothetical protein n=1 Tax=Agromyces sp. LHK192 TaxID=2498704 RepID=UPI000FD842BC|nr:hypothetical protein [Agromyces sp. LHK192]